MKGRRTGWLAPAAFLADRLTKLWAQEALRGQGPMAVWPGVLQFRYVENTGAAFGILQGQQALLLVLTGAALAGVLCWLLTRGRSLPAFARGALWLLLGGAAGNFADRLFHGAVVDFLEIELFSFPVFNIADCFVTVGAFLVLIDILFVNRNLFSDSRDGGDGKDKKSAGNPADKAS